ncbi:MAG: TatD family hydrolase [Deferribacteraceae bacterium]|jgi:TatD DNase family protein|nr:TatD family hydrolase [Deferribacteraceae bacterium]
MNIPLLTDSHAHIHMPPLNEYTDDIVRRAAESNVKRIVTIGIDLADSIKAVEVANRYDNVYACVGVHPHDSEQFNFKDLGRFEKLLQNPKVIGVGEIGLDYYRNNSPKDIQIEVFAVMLDMAISAKLPIIIHTREATEDTIIQLDNILGGLDHPILFHCFNGADPLIEWGLQRKNCFFSFAGNVTYPKAIELHNAVAKLPLERLLIETDCPYLAPVPMRGKQNEPANLPHTAAYIAKRKGIPVELLAEQMEENFKRLFNI